MTIEILFVTDVIETVYFPLLVGSLLTMIVSLILSSVNTKNDLRKVLIEKRVKLYEKITSICLSLNQHYNPTDEESQLKKYEEFRNICPLFTNKAKVNIHFSIPSLFFNKENLLSFSEEISHLLSDSRIYIQRKLYFELFALQSYTSHLFSKFVRYPSESLKQIGFLLDNDLLDYCWEIERLLQLSLLTTRFFSIPINQKTLEKYVIKRNRKTIFYKVYFSKLSAEYLPCINCSKIDICPRNKIYRESRI